MHIQEGYLPMEWCMVWYILSIIVVAIGIIQLRKVIKENPEAKKILTINGIVMFLVSLLGVSSLKGCESSPLVNGLSGSIFGPAVTSVVVAIVLLLQAIILGYGGITTLGANIFAMGVVGPLAACIVYYFLNRTSIPDIVSLMFAVLIANIFTLATTALQFTLVYGESFFMFLTLLALPQAFLVIVDLIVSIILFIALKSMFKDSKIFSQELNDFFKIG